MHRRVPIVALSLAALGVLGALGAGAASQSPPEAPAAQQPAPAAQPPALDTAHWPDKPWPPGMVWIPAGEFTMGTDGEGAMANERPAHRVKLDGFWMDEHDVTNAEFERFVEATGYLTVAERPVDWEELKQQVPPGTPKPPDEMLLPGSLAFTPPDGPVDLRSMGNWWTWTTGTDWKHPDGPKSTIEARQDVPVLQVAWDDAVAYAQWAHKRLPTEAEWEYASRGGAASNTRYWWGDEFQAHAAGDGTPARFMCNSFTGDFPYHDTAADGFAGVSPVKSFPPNGYGLYDMAGNVWQWTADVYRSDAHALAADEAAKSPGGCCLNPRGPVAAFNPVRAMPEVMERVVKGGSFLCHPSYCESYRPTARRGMPPDTGTGHTGFRCVLTQDEWAKVR
jgi:formylglycine-generating enzyme required for sulfatase activity